MSAGSPIPPPEPWSPRLTFICMMAAAVFCALFAARVVKTLRSVNGDRMAQPRVTVVRGVRFTIRENRELLARIRQIKEQECVDEVRAAS